MSEDFNPKAMNGNLPGDESSPLSNALEELLAGRFTGSGEGIASPGIPFGSSGLAVPMSEPRLAHPPAAPCPPREDWILLTQTISDTPDAEATKKVNTLLAHASVCSGCAEQLRALSADLSPDEAILLTRFTLASPEGQRDLAARLAATAVVSGRPQPIGKPTHASRLKLWTSLSLAASLLIALGLGLWWRATNNPERLLAQAYAHDRIFALRMPGAAFAEVTPNLHLRGASASREPAKLREARSRIDRQLESAPDDPQLLELEARSDTLEEKFDPAIEILERLVATGPITAKLLVDDASAYFERGQATGSDTDRATALDYLRRADELAPGDTVVLFNEAIAMEDRGQLMNAVETWNRYLRLERDPRWQTEGRQRLQALEDQLNRIKTRPEGTDRPPALPSS